MESSCATEIDIAKAPFQVYRTKTEGELSQSQGSLTVPRFDLLMLQACNEEIHEA